MYLISGKYVNASNFKKKLSRNMLLKRFPWAPDRNPFAQFVTALPQAEDRDWVENIYSIWRFTKQRAIELRHRRLVMAITRSERVKQTRI